MWAPDKYLEQFSVTSDAWEVFLTSSLHEAVQNGKVKGPRGIDVGCGPTIHRMSILGKVCEELIACDYQDSNVAYINNWLKDSRLDEQYTDLLTFIAELEGCKDVQILTNRLRSRLKHVVQFDVTNRDSVSKLAEYGGLYDCALSNGCLEAACLTRESYHEAISNIANLLKPGSTFILGGYLGASSYIVNGEEFQCLNIDLKTVKQALEDGGLILDSIKFGESQAEYERSQSNAYQCFFAVCFKK